MANCMYNLASIPLKFTSLVELLNYRAIYQPHQTAYTFLVDGETEGVSITYEELDQKARDIAATLEGMKATGERALLLYPPGLEFITAFFGCLYAGVIAVPVYPPRRNQGLSRLQAIATDAQAKFALTTTSVLISIEQRFSEEPALAALHCIDTDNLTSNQFLDWQVLTFDDNQLAFLQYTSGSTGIPKGVMVSHGNILHNLGLIQQFFDATTDTLGVSWLPPYHDMGLIGGILEPLYIGAPIILMSPVAFLQKPWRWLRAISHYKANTSGGPNFAYDLCINKITSEQRESLDLSSWQLAFNGSEPVRAETLERFAATFAPNGFRIESFYPCYGMAETTLITSGGLKTHPPVVYQVEGTALTQNQVVVTNDEQIGSRKIVSCGQASSDGKIAIVNPESLQECSPSQIGEIWVSSASVAQGYWHRPEQTEQTFNAYLADTRVGPFLRTGDLGFLQDGELFVTGRLKDVIIIRGRNHYPQDIELTLEQSHPALRPGHGAAFSVDIDGQERLVIAQEVERSYLRHLKINEVVTAICQAVAQHHEIQVYAILLLKTGGIPKTSSGKIQRHACRTGFLNNSLDVVSDWTANPRMKAEFRDLQEAVELLEQQLQTHKSPPSLSVKNDADEQVIIQQGFQNAETIQAWLVSQIREYLKDNSLDINIQDIDVSKPFTNYGLDSVALIEISSHLEKWLGLGLSPTILYDYSTIATLAEHLQALQMEELLAKVDQLSDHEVDLYLQKLLN